MCRALGLPVEPITCADKHATLKWEHARLLLNDGCFITPTNWDVKRDGVAVEALSMKGHNLLDLLRKSEVKGILQEMRNKTSIALATEGTKVAFKAAIDFIVNTAQTGF